MNKRNTPFAESIMNCGATFLNPDTTPSLCYKAAKKFVDAYEHKEHEQTLDDWIREMKTYASLIYDFSKEFVDVYEREEHEEHEQRHESQAVPVKWSDEKQRAYGKLLDCAIGRMSPETICDAAIELAQACKPERENPKAGEVYRDILGNKYIVTAVHDSFPDDARGNKPFIVLKHVESNGRIALSDYFSPYLEDFLNPTFKKYN